MKYLLIASLTMTACAACSSADLSVGKNKEAISPSDASSAACTFGQDQTCNPSPAISALYGSCNADNTCSCRDFALKDPDTGKCFVPSTPICTFGKDETCNEIPTISSLHGTCTADATCDCRAFGQTFPKNEFTGRCR